MLGLLLSSEDKEALHFLSNQVSTHKGSKLKFSFESLRFFLDNSKERLGSKIGGWNWRGEKLCYN